MDEIKHIITRIVKGCAQAGVQVPDVLAAFIARTIVESKSSTFALDRKITPEGVEEVIMQSIERLLERDSPSLELVKMQVEYDMTYLNEDNEADRKLKSRNKVISGHKNDILHVVMEDANDFEGLTTLYRKIFKFLLEFAPNSKPADRNVEREVAAALESVFPRVGLKAFIQLADEEKAAQLLELARIILGIRLFNREEGRGGAGIDHMDGDGKMLATILSQDIDREVEYFSDACDKYQNAIVRGNMMGRRLANEMRLEESRKSAMNDPDQKLNELSGSIDFKDTSVSRINSSAKDEYFQSSKTTTPFNVTESMVERWSEELANRRQYLGFLRTIQDETHLLNDKISQICESIRLELINIKALVTNKTSVAKEVVYPRFDALGTLWLQLYEQIVVMIARSNTFQALCKYRLSFVPTLSEQFYSPDKMTAEAKGTNWSRSNAPSEMANFRDAATALDPLLADAKDFGFTHSDGDHVDQKHSMERNDPNWHGEGGTTDSQEIGEIIQPDKVHPSGATLLTVETTPDFLLLPLELQGYCPCTIVESKGLLIPGKPMLGMVKYQNQYFVFDHQAALRSFVQDPDRYLLSIKSHALHHPEYIHLLKLQRWFPTASIPRLLKTLDAEANDQFAPRTKDASTGTPTHFSDSYVDVNYHWNEWELRRRALKIINLKNCATTSQQTDESHFRRDNDTQVYQLKEKETQTRKDQGSNPAIVTTFVAGFRGKKYLIKEDGDGNEDNDEEEKQRMEDKEELNRIKLSYSKSKDNFLLEVPAESKESTRVSSGSSVKMSTIADKKKLRNPKVGVVTLTLDL